MKGKGLKVNDFIRWIAKDDKGTFSYKGVVEGVGSDAFDLRTADGVMTIRFDDGKVEAVKASKTVRALAKKAEKKATKAAVAKKERTPRAESKYARFKALVESTKESGGDVSRKAMIEKGVAEVGLTKAGASTYFAKAKKELGL